MNPLDLTATDLMVWGLVIHLVADWLLQNEWMQNKVNPRHPAGYVHAGIHGLGLALIFGWVAAPLAVAHFLIDLRTPVAWWSRLIRQTQPSGKRAVTWEEPQPLAVVDIGTEVRFWNDQVWHIACIAIAAVLVGGLS